MNQMKYIYYPSDFNASLSNDSKSSKRIFLDLDGVLMNFTKAAAMALDGISIPINYNSPIININPVFENNTEQVLFDICSGYDFYSDMEEYPWANMIFSNILTNNNMENVYFLVRHNKYDFDGWSGKAHWVNKHFGAYGTEHLIMVSSHNPNVIKNLLSINDILIDDDIRNIEKWCKDGGVGFHWKEIDWRADEKKCIEEVYNRLISIGSIISAKK
jgi:5'(3')-deoxyribonucleotidase